MLRNKLNYFQTRPKLEKIDAASYLERLGLADGNADLKFLKSLHRAHLLNIPFENLDIHYGKKIILSIHRIFDKIIYRKRGGICYELNALFYHLLNELGYNAFLASAKVFKEEGILTPEYDHMIILVTLKNETYLVDVGFGALFSEPKRISNQPQLDYTEYYRFITDPDGFYVLQQSKDGSDYKSIYRFDLTAREMIIFLERCNFHQESMDSHLKQNKIISQLFREGRITLTDRKLKMRWEGEETESLISSEDEFLAKLDEHFKIDSRILLSQQFH